jgi:cyclopropane fatty-acyl-phospholipid synthase-like methyltransferase
MTSPPARTRSDFTTICENKPLDRAMISAFAGLVGLNGNRLVADVGCGTGATTGMFCDYGLDAVGIDLSHNMVAEAGSAQSGTHLPRGLDDRLAIRGQPLRRYLRVVFNHPCAG